MKTLATIALALLLSGCMGNGAGYQYNPALAQALANVSNQWQGRMQYQQMLNMQQQIYNQRQQVRPVQCFNLGGVVQCQ
ncbi:MAG: hypothetical protein ACR2RF_33145 [Geminicoccaceae bacterium]